MDAQPTRKETQVTEIWSCRSSECEIYSFWDVTPCGFAAFAQFSKFSASYGTRRFITIFIRARHLSLSWATSIQSMPLYPSSWTSILILSSNLRLGLPSVLIPSGFPTKTLYTLLLPQTCYKPRLSYFSRFNDSNNIGWRVQMIKLVNM